LVWLQAEIIEISVGKTITTVSEKMRKYWIKLVLSVLFSIIVAVLFFPHYIFLASVIVLLCFAGYSIGKRASSSHLL